MKPKQPNSAQSYLKEFIKGVEIADRRQRGQLRELFKHKLSHHLNMLQYHQLREDRFALAQQLTLQKQNDAAERAKDYLQLKQNKAMANKSHSLLERSRRAEGGLARWESVVDKNRQKYERELRQAKAVIRLWNQKLNQSSVRKSNHLEEVSRELKSKLEAREKRIMSLRVKGELSPLLIENNSQHLRSLKSSPKDSPRRQSRVSTESFLEKKRQQDAEEMKQSINKTVGKEQRINQARYMRHYYQERRRKQHFDKEEMLKAMRHGNLTSLRESQENRLQIIERRLSKDRQKQQQLQQSRQRVRGTQSLKAVFNAFGQSPENQEHPSPNRNYCKLMTQKLKDISSVMRKGRAKP